MNICYFQLESKHIYRTRTGSLLAAPANPPAIANFSAVFLPLSDPNYVASLSIFGRDSIFRGGFFFIRSQSQYENLFEAVPKKNSNFLKKNSNKTFIKKEKEKALPAKWAANGPGP